MRRLAPRDSGVDALKLSGTWGSEKPGTVAAAHGGVIEDSRPVINHDSFKLMI